MMATVLEQLSKPTKLNDIDNLARVLSIERVACGINAESKKRALELASQLLTARLPQLETSHVLELLVNRERLGSTSIGSGVAIPHCRCTGLLAPTAALLRLAQPIDFAASDKQSVDLLVALVVPEHAVEEHLSLLASIAELFSSPALLKNLRHAHDANSLYQALIGYHE